MSNDLANITHIITALH